MPNTQQVVETRDQFAVYLDVNEDFTFADNEWARVDKSTINDLVLNENAETKGYIDSATDSTEVTEGAPSQDLEIANIRNNPVYDFLKSKIIHGASDEKAKVPCLYCFAGTEQEAWRGVVTLTGLTLRTVDKMITFTINWDNHKIGTYTITAGVPSFTPATP